MGLITAWRQKVGALKTEVYALYLAYRDPRVPWYAKVVLDSVIGYAISPIDLIPDFIPVLGYLDDLVIVPAGVWLAVKMIPPSVMRECREKARTESISSRVKWVVALAIIAVWILVLYLAVKLVLQLLSGK